MRADLFFLKQRNSQLTAARDLHSLDPTVNLHGPSFFVRRHSILANLHPFKGVIVSDRMYLMLPKDDMMDGNDPNSVVPGRGTITNDDYASETRYNVGKMRAFLNFTSKVFVLTTMLNQLQRDMVAISKSGLGKIYLKF